MGSYNTLVWTCPACGHKNEYQTKAGTCMLTRKPLSAGDIEDVADFVTDAQNGRIQCECGCPVLVVAHLKVDLYDEREMDDA